MKVQLTFKNLQIQLHPLLERKRIFVCFSISLSAKSESHFPRWVLAIDVRWRNSVGRNCCWMWWI